MASAGVSAGTGANGVNGAKPPSLQPGKSNRKTTEDELLQLTLQLRNKKDCGEKYATFHGDRLIGYDIPPSVGFGGDLEAILSLKNWPALGRLIGGYVDGKGVDGVSAAQIAGGLSDYSELRNKFIDSQVKSKYDKMLHPPLTYLGDAFQYRTVDGKFNSVLHPHLGQAGAPYAKTVPSKTPPLGALPDPGDLFDKLMARKEGGRESKSGLSSMLVYHATIIIHDIFRTNDHDKNISDSSSYLDLSPLYGYTTDMQRQIRDGRYGHGLLKPDAFAEDRLLRQPPGVCIMLVMYNRYHNYAAKQLYRINENNRFRVPMKYSETKHAALAKYFAPPFTEDELPTGPKQFDKKLIQLCEDYDAAWRKHEAAIPVAELEVTNECERCQKYEGWQKHGAAKPEAKYALTEECEKLQKYKRKLDDKLIQWGTSTEEQRQKFEAEYDAAWAKLDDDLFNTARLITCGMYIQISVHDYLRALMGFHQFDTNFTLDPRTDFDQRQTTRGLGNQVTVEFNLLYRFHCAISLRDEKYTETLFQKMFGMIGVSVSDPSKISLQEWLNAMNKIAKLPAEKKPWEMTFGVPYSENEFKRNTITNLFDDQQMIDALTTAMDTPISNFGPCNVPKCLRPVEIMGILQARKWEIGTLNDFREFFGMGRHQTFESVSENLEIQNSLRDLYEHPDKIELYPGIFCESDEKMGLDPGPSEASSALWTAIFSDAITLVRSDRFYTVDWNTNSLTSWGMNEVTPNNEICKSSVFHRLIQRAFPAWFEYDSIRFFHPFYTAKQNTNYAKQQGYERDFTSAKPVKPQKPVTLDNFADIRHVLDCPDNTFIHPVLYHEKLHNGTLLPEQLRKVLEPEYQRAAYDAVLLHQDLKLEPALREYLKDLMHAIIKRESVSMTNATFQIDVTRDFAIPVATRYVADFLGFGNLLRTETNPKGSYSENEIYQHITNCQIFLAYNADETKLMKRAKAFNSSMKFLIELTKHANIASANQWDIRGYLFGRKRDNPMTELGFFIAQRLLQWNRDADMAAASLLLISLDLAYDSVISFTAVVHDLMKELYKAANNPEPHKPTDNPKTTELPPTRLEVQTWAFDDTKESALDQEVWKRARTMVKLPVVRVATKRSTFGSRTFEKNEVIIMDIQRATKTIVAKGVPIPSDTLSATPIVGIFGASQTNNFNQFALTAMVRFILQMKNMRRGHDSQGHLKRVFLNWTAEGYSNFMASGRMEWIREQVCRLDSEDQDKDVFTSKALRPSTDTYLTPNWDEMVPFPMTWKIRFDGFGESNYRSNDSTPYGCLKTAWTPDDAPPWYQPQGPSHSGGSFGDVDYGNYGGSKGFYSNGCGLGTA